MNFARAARYKQATPNGVFEVANRLMVSYIHNQPKHHARRSFREEYLRFLRKFEIDHEERFIFQDVLSER